MPTAESVATGGYGWQAESRSFAPLRMTGG